MKSKLSFTLIEHKQLSLIRELRTKDLEGVRNVEVSKILMSFRKILIMHKCVTWIELKVNFYLWISIASQEARQLKSRFRM